jgi:hypothetical protein
VRVNVTPSLTADFPINVIQAIFHEIKEESMTKNGDFVQNLQNRSTSKEFSVAEPIMHSGFFRLKHSYTIAEQKKTPYRRFPMAAILLKKSQVIMAT